MQMAIPCLDPSMFEPELLRQWIRGAKRGEAASFEKLVVLHERRVLRLAQRLLLNREAAEDVAQDVFMRLHKRIRSVAEDKDLGPWLYRTTVNLCIDRLRRSKDEMPFDLVPEVPDDCDNPEQSAANRERQQFVSEALKALTPRERQAIVLRDLEGHSTSEVAHMLGSSDTTVRSQISTGRVKMRNFLLERFGGRL